MKPSVGVGEACRGRESLGCKWYMFKFAGVGQSDSVGQKVILVQEADALTLMGEGKGAKRN